MQLRAGLLCLFAMFWVGCGPKVIPIQTAKVTGVAKFDGKPLENYRVFFYCDAAAANEPATGLVQKDGTFTLTVRNPGDGAIVGQNKIWFSYDPPLPEETPGMESGKAPPPPTVKLPAKYLNSSTSELSVEVTAAGLTDYLLDLK